MPDAAVGPEDTVLGRPCPGKPRLTNYNLSYLTEVMSEQDQSKESPPSL